MGDVPTLSASGINSFLTCPRQYLYSNVYRIPGIGNLAMSIGTAVHAAAEAFWKRPRRSLEAARASFAAELENVPPAEIAADMEAWGDIERMVATYQREVAPHFTPTMVEKEFLVEVDGLRLSGTIDAADENDVRDIKTRAGMTINGKKPSAFDPLKHQLQLSLYGVAFRALTGRAPKRLLLDVISRTAKYKQYEVAPDYGGMLDAAHLVADGIVRAEFPPSGALNGACNWCSFKTICPSSTAVDAVGTMQALEP